MFAPARLLIQKLYEAFTKSNVRRSTRNTCKGFKFGELGDFFVSSESFTYGSRPRAGIVDRHVLCAQNPMHLAESAAPPAVGRN